MSESAACTCRSEVVKANAKPGGPDNRYIGHECSCPRHWKATRFVATAEVPVGETRDG